MSRKVCMTFLIFKINIGFLFKDSIETRVAAAFRLLIICVRSIVVLQAVEDTISETVFQNFLMLQQAYN